MSYARIDPAHFNTHDSDSLVLFDIRALLVEIRDLLERDTQEADRDAH